MSTTRNRRALAQFLSAHGLLLGCVGLFTSVVAARLPKEFGQDAWLALVGGRQVASTGIPHHDVLTAWTSGASWIDQQWLAQLLAYGVYKVGGITLLALTHVLLLTAAVGGAAAVACRRGATARTVAWLLVAAIYPTLYAGGAVRTQSFVLPLYVALLALLVHRTGGSPYRAFAALPLLVLWANLHGSVVVAAGLVALYGLVGLRAAPVRNALLVIGAGGSLFATPYGLDMAAYYRQTLANPAFRSLVTEWGAPTPSLVNAPIFLLVGAAIWLLARHTKEIGVFALVAELALIALSLGAVRSVVWLGLGSIVLLAPALDAELGHRELAVERMNRSIAVVGVYAALLIIAVIAWRGDGPLTQSFPKEAGATVARLAHERPSSLVYSNERFADWLLFQHPELAGRVAFDARFELLEPSQLQRIFDWTNQVGRDWRAATAGSDVIVLDMSDESPLAARLSGDRSLRKAYANSDIAVFTTLHD